MLRSCRVPSRANAVAVMMRLVAPMVPHVAEEAWAAEHAGDATVAERSNA